MVINAVCPHCKRVYPVDEQYAGQTFTCETCGNPFTVPTPGAAQPVSNVPAVPADENFAAPGEISRNRRFSAVISFVMSGLLYISACCCGLGGAAILAIPNAVPQGMPAGVLAAACFVIAVFSIIIGTVYLVCGINIRKGGFASAVLALVVASLHELITLIMMIMAIVQAALAGFRGGTAGQFVFVLLIYGLFIVALGQLIYFLIKVVREPRG
jgi:hypothetical protein